MAWTKATRLLVVTKDTGHVSHNGNRGRRGWGGGTALAGPTYTFNLDQSSAHAISAGTVTIAQDGSAVDVTFVPTSGWGILNTGGPHTPFAFNLSSTTGLQLSWTTPAGGSAPLGNFTLNTGGGDNTPFGTFNAAIDYSVGNGGVNKYTGNLEFTLSYTSGTLDTTDFIANSGGYFFSADAIDKLGNTGASAAKAGTIVPTPEPSALAVLGVALVGLGLIRPRRAA